MWSQESFTTLVRSTAQGTIISVARVMAAPLALVTPAARRGWAAGAVPYPDPHDRHRQGAAIFAFHGGRRNEFTVGNELAEPTTTMPA